MGRPFVHGEVSFSKLSVGIGKQTGRSENAIGSV